MSNWADTTGDTVDVADVAAGYSWSVGDEVRIGTNTALSLPTAPPLPGQFWYGTFGGEQPALSAVDPSANVPVFGPGEAVLVDGPMPEFECSDVIHTVCANTGETKTHCFTPVDEGGNPIDLMGSPLVFVVERGDRVDTETGLAAQDPDTLKVSFEATQAHDNEGTFPFAVRMVSGNRLVGRGDIVVSYAPDIGSPQFENGFCFTVTHEITGDPLENALVTVTDSTGEIVATPRTDKNGDVSGPLPAGMYTAEFFFEDFKFEPYHFEVPE